MYGDVLVDDLSRSLVDGLVCESHQEEMDERRFQLEDGGQDALRQIGQVDGHRGKLLLTKRKEEIAKRIIKKELFIKYDRTR